MPSISALSGVQWTQLNGANLSGTQETQLTNLVDQASGLVTTTEALMKARSGTFSLNQVQLPTHESEAAARAALVANQRQNNFEYASYRKEDGTIGYLTGGGGSYMAYLTGTSTSTYIRNLDDSGIAYNILADGRLNITGHPVTFIRQGSYAASSANTLFTDALRRFGHTADSQLTDSQWRDVLRVVNEQRFINASKLTVANGGGIKTHNGNWYVNGEKVSYLEVTFAVRVNQLYVVNETITEQLKQVQANNKKIKFANSISSIIANKTPSNSSSTQEVNEVAAQILLEAVKEGLIPLASSEAEAKSHLNTKAATYPNGAPNLCSFYRGADGSIQLLMRNWNGPFWSQTVSTLTATNMVDSLKSYTGNFDLTQLKAYFPNSFEKCFVGNSIKTSGTLSQTECTTMTTELKSTITNIDSNNQILQTQLAQYNDKRTEVLDSMSSIIKGHNNSMAGMGRNLNSV